MCSRGFPVVTLCSDGLTQSLVLSQNLATLIIRPPSTPTHLFVTLFIQENVLHPNNHSCSQCLKCVKKLSSACDKLSLIHGY